MTARFVIDTSIGAVEIVYQNEHLSRINLNCQKLPSMELTKFEKNVQAQLDSYFADARFEFNLPVAITGTPHQKAVWAQMQKIPAGNVMTYGEIAKLIGSSGQAVGNACRQNPVPILIPCHRVVAANAIGGFAGATQGVLVKIKQSLLAHEGLGY